MSPKRRADLFWAAFYGLLFLLFVSGLICFECCGETSGARGIIPAAFVLRSGDTMTGTLIISNGGDLTAQHDVTVANKLTVTGAMLAETGESVKIYVPLYVDLDSGNSLTIETDPYFYGWEHTGDIYARNVHPAFDEGGQLGKTGYRWGLAKIMDATIDGQATIALAAITNGIATTSFKMGTGPSYGLEMSSNGEMFFRPALGTGWVAMDLTGYTGSPAANDYVFNMGDFGGYLDHNYSINALGQIYCNEVFPWIDNTGRVGDFGTGAKFAEGGFLSLQCDTEIRLPTDIESQGAVGPGVSTDVVWTLDYYEGPPNQFEDLVIGNTDRGTVRITPYGEMEIDVYGVGSLNALTIDGTFFDKDGDFQTASTSILELAGLEGLTPGYGYDLTNELDDVATTLGMALPIQIHGTQVTLKNLHVAIETLRNEDYLTSAAIYQRAADNNTASSIWSDGTDHGNGSTGFTSWSYDLGDLQPARYYFIEFQYVCGPVTGQAILQCRTALEYTPEDNP